VDHLPRYELVARSGSSPEHDDLVDLRILTPQADGSFTGADAREGTGDPNDWPYGTERSYNALRLPGVL
jgi:hypothetical protein